MQGRWNDLDREGWALAVGSQTSAESPLLIGGAGLALIMLRLLTWGSFTSIGLILSVAGAAAVVFPAWRSMKERCDAVRFTRAAGEKS